MADPNAFYEPEEEELLSSLAVPQYGGEEGYDEESYRHIQELEQRAYAQQIAAAEKEQAAALEQVPEDVKRVRRAKASKVGQVLTACPVPRCVPPGHPRQ